MQASSPPTFVGFQNKYVEDKFREHTQSLQCAECQHQLCTAEVAYELYTRFVTPATLDRLVHMIQESHELLCEGCMKDLDDSLSN